MTNQREIILYPFDGFYNTNEGDQINNWIEFEVEYLQSENKPIPEFNYQSIRYQYAKEYTALINNELPDEIQLTFQELDSPREYNFTNDRIVCTISDESIKYLEANINIEILARIISDTFTSYDGFCSHYSNDINEWYEKPVTEWDHNELETLLSAYVVEMEDFPGFYELTELLHESVDLYASE